MSPSSKEPKLSRLKQQAIDWLVLLRSGEINDAELCAFAEWLAEDHAHSEAFADAEMLFDDMTLAAKKSVACGTSEHDAEEQPNDLPPLLKSQRSKRVEGTWKQYRCWLAPAFTLAACWLIAVFLYFPPDMQFLDRLVSDYHAQTGELLEIRLSDGSRLLLNTQSAVSVDYDDFFRKITLHYGQVSFSVAKDSVRPFEVKVGNINVRALGTVFQIYKTNEHAVDIVVQEHAVVVQKDFEDQAQAGFTVQAGQQMHIQPDGAPVQPATADLSQVTAWQQKRLIINDRPLIELISELERYRNGRIFVAEEKLKSLHVTGVFSLEKPDDVLNSVSAALNLKLTSLGPWWVLLHR